MTAWRRRHRRGRGGARWATVLLAAATTGAASGCAGTPTVPDESPAYSGEIVAVFPASESEDRSGDRLATVWIKESVDEECGIRFAIRSDTDLFHRHEPATVADLRPGQAVDVWFDGIVLTSCPGQARADVLRIR